MDELETWLDKGVTDGLPVILPIRERAEREPWQQQPHQDPAPRGLVQELPASAGVTGKPQPGEREEHGGRRKDREGAHRDAKDGGPDGDQQRERRHDGADPKPTEVGNQCHGRLSNLA